MKITYDEISDIFYIGLNDNYPSRTDESIPGLAVEIDEGGKLCGLEIEDASQVIANLKHLDFELLSEEDESVLAS